jgi:transposase-like protein
MGRRSAFTPEEKRDAVLDVLSKRTTISEVNRPGLSDRAR